MFLNGNLAQKIKCKQRHSFNLHNKLKMAKYYKKHMNIFIIISKKVVENIDKLYKNINSVRNVCFNVKSFNFYTLI